MVSYQRTEAVAVTLLCSGWQIWNILNLHYFEVGIIWHHVDPLSPSVFLPSFDLCFQKGHFGFLCLQFLNFINTMPAVKPFPPTEKTKNNIEKKTYENQVKSSNIIQHPTLHLYLTYLTPRSKTPLVDVPWPLHPHQSLPALWRLSPDEFSLGASWSKGKSH